jgi:enoyl-[acyl-carrier protein] reductase III
MDPFDIREKKVLVTGGTRGLGLSISFHLASQGAHVIAGYLQNDEAAEASRKEAISKGYSYEVVKASLMVSSASRWGRLDVLVHNAATGVHKPLEALTQRHFSIVWQVNVGAFFELATKLRHLMPSGSRVIAISSEGARKAVLNYGPVGSSKAALEALCRQMAVEWAPSGTNVNLVAPGLLETDTLKVWEDRDFRVRQEVDSIPINRLVRLEEVARVVHFLASSASEAIVGQTILVDGGKSIAAFKP